jgi:hypothetical protein
MKSCSRGLLVARLRGCLEMGHDSISRSNDALLESETWSGVASDPHGVFASDSAGSTEGVKRRQLPYCTGAESGAGQRKPHILKMGKLSGP